MKIYLDGCDGSGKSTLAKYIANRFGLDIFCLTKNSEKTIERYLDIAFIDNVVYDRTFFSEIVYPNVFKRKEWLNEFQIQNLIKYYNSLFVICTAPDYIIQDRLRRRGYEFEEITNNISYINKKYQEIAQKYDLMIVDTYELSLDDIGDEIERRLKW